MRNRLHVAISAAILFVGLHGSRASLAQEPGPAPLEQTVARNAFLEGVVAATEGRWEDARAAFERSYALVASPATLLNLAGAQVRSGALVAGAESYRRLLRETDREDLLAPARTALAEVEPRISHVTVTVEGLSGGDIVRVDGRSVAPAVLGAPMPVDPGTRVVRIERRARVLAERTLMLREGGGETLSLTVPPFIAPPEENSTWLADSTATEQQRSVFASPWFWAGTAGAIAVGATVVIVVLLRGGSAREEKFRGNADPGAVEL